MERSSCFLQSTLDIFISSSFPVYDGSQVNKMICIFQYLIINLGVIFISGVFGS